MRTSTVGLYALRLTFGQTSSQLSAQTPSSIFASSNAAPDRVVTRSATMLAVFGIALSSFSLKQMLTNSGSENVREKSTALQIR